MYSLKNNQNNTKTGHQFEVSAYNPVMSTEQGFDAYN